MPELLDHLRPALADRYQIERELGRGGMAVVYLARDLRHHRPVAIKVLSAELGPALGAERFLREIEIAAQLTHPRIVPLLDSGAADGLLYYVMPYITGESLRARLQRETQLPIDDACDITREIAAALAYAHRHGVVHRDIKPENVLLQDGEALVSDFGVARAITVAGGARLTQSGIAVGTPVYMSPEQASSEHGIDGRSDIYALGCVLYEMLAGEPPFVGPTVQVVAARKLTETPRDVSVARDSVPPAVAVVVRRALARMPADRYATAGEFAQALRQAQLSGHTIVAAAASVAPPLHGRARTLTYAGGIALVVAAVAIAVLAPRIWRRDVTTSTEPVRLMAALPPNVRLTREIGGGSSLALSPDGRMLVSAGRDDTGARLYRRMLDRLEVEPIPGTEGGQSPFFSPDGRWLGFYADGRLRRVPAEGGMPIDITALRGRPQGASWGPDNRIVFASGISAPLHVVAASGGVAEPLTTLDTAAGELRHIHPEFLPDGRTLLFVSLGRQTQIHALDVRSGRRVALTDGSTPRYMATGHVVFGRGNTLLAARFDPARLELASDAVPVAENVLEDDMMHYAVSRSGTLAYVPGSREHVLALRTTDGTERLVTDARATYMNPQFSPDGRLLAVTRRDRASEDIWIHDLETGSVSRHTFDGGRVAVWIPDGSAVTYVVPGRGIFSRRADGRDSAQLVLALDQFHWLIGWTPDGRTLGIGTLDRGLVALQDGELRVVVPGSIWGGRLSRDGRWLAFYTGDSGRFEVYVTRFPAGGARWQVSLDGGRDPMWHRNGAELLYRSGDQLIAARIDTVAGVRATAQRIVLEPYAPPFYDDYDIRPGDHSLVFVKPADEPNRAQIVLVLNWFTELQRAAPRN